MIIHQKCDVFKIAKWMVKANYNIIGDQCVRNNDGVLAFNDENRKELGKTIMRNF